MYLKRFIGDKTFYRNTLSIAIPIMLQQLISTSVNLVNNMMVGQLGDAALAGVATVNRFFIIAVFGTQGIIAASAVFMAQYLGARNHERMQQTFRFALLASSAIMLSFVVLALCFPQTIISFFVNDSTVIEAGSRYITMIALSSIPNMLTLTIAGMMRATGDSKSPLFASITSVICSVVFSYVLIHGAFGIPAYGIEGGATAVFLARLVELIVIASILLTRDYPFKTKLRDSLEIPRILIKRILLKALPLGFNEILWGCGMALLMRFYATRGADVLSGYAISTTVSDLFFTTNAGMSVATTILISQALGAGRFDEARQNGYRLLGFGVILSMVFGSLMFMSTWVLPYIYDVSPVALQTAQSFLRIMSCLFAIYVLNTACYFILRAGVKNGSSILLMMNRY